VIDLLKVFIGQRSFWVAALALAAGYLGVSTESSEFKQLVVGGGAGLTAVVAVLTYWVHMPAAQLVKKLASSMPLFYAALGVIGPPDMADPERAQAAQALAGLAGVLLQWSARQPNTLAEPERPALRARNPA